METDKSITGIKLAIPHEAPRLREPPGFGVIAYVVTKLKLAHD